MGATSDDTKPDLGKKPELGNVLVVGGCGFLGHHIVRQILSSYDYTALSVLDFRTDNNQQPGVSYHNADITSASSVTSALEKIRPSVIVHTASPTATTDGASSSEKVAKRSLYYKVNVEGTKNLLECAASIGTVKAFVYTSSASVVHDSVSDLIDADENYPVLRSPIQKEYYSETKGMAEEAVLAFNRSSQSPQMLTCALRPASIFGEGDMQLVPNLYKAYENGQTRFQLGQNENLFDFTYVGNVAHAHLLAVIALLQTSKLTTQPLDHEKVDGEAFFITNTSPVYFWDFARTVWAAAGDKTEPKSVWIINKDVGIVIATLMEWIYWIATFGGTPNLTRFKVQYSCMTRYYSANKAARLLMYKPIYGLPEAIERTVKWFAQKQGHALEKKAQ